MKKIVLVTVFCVILCAFIPMQAFSQYATGNAVGASINTGYSGNTLAGLSFTGKTESLPYIFGASLSFAGENLGIGITADSWIIHNELGRVGLADVLLYLGPGADVGITLGNVLAIDLGARMPIGLSWLVDSPGWENWEIFTELVLGLNLIGVSLGESSAVSLLGIPLGQESDFNVFNTIGLGFNVGFRYWL